MKNTKNIYTFTSILVAIAIIMMPIQSCQRDEIIKEDNVEQTPLSLNEKKVLLKNFQNKFFNSADKFAGLISNKKKDITSKSGFKSQDLSATQLNELKVLEHESKTFVKNYCGLSDEDLKKVSGAKNEECFIILSMIILETEKAKNKKNSKNNINLRSFARSQNANPELEWGEVGTCALAAIGADLLYGTAFTGKEATKWTVKAISKTFNAIASRALGAVGVGIAAAVFSYCLYEQSND
jgi:hypothetical protein